MKIKDLIEILQRFDPEKDAIVQIITNRASVDRLLASYKNDPVEMKFGILVEVAEVRDNNGHAQLNVEYYEDEEE